MFLLPAGPAASTTHPWSHDEDATVPTVAAANAAHGATGARATTPPPSPERIFDALRSHVH